MIISRKKDQTKGIYFGKNILRIGQTCENGNTKYDNNIEGFLIKINTNNDENIGLSLSS